MTPGQRADALVAEYCISDPADLDIEAISFAAGMTVEYRNLIGCEATLVGYGNQAIAMINPSSVRGRERFSIGHELGHWTMHRGRSFRCRVDDPEQNLTSSAPVEKEADEFAAHLLMPSSLFVPKVKALGKPSLHDVEALGNTFGASLLATCLRLTDINTLPIVIACYSMQRRHWWKAAAHVPNRWFLKDTLDEDSFAYDLLTSGKARQTLGKQSADAWFKNDDADDYELLEHCIGRANGQVLVLLYLPESVMTNTRFDETVLPRRFNQHGSYVGKRRF